MGNYVLAVSSYREFLTLFPQHPKSDYAQFRAGESYFKQMGSPDRDQTATHQALEEYQRLLDVYPQSTWVEPARDKIRQCRQALARADFQVGYFYQKTRKSWRSAIGRYETIVTEYPDYEKFDEVLFRLSQCLAFSGRYAEARPQLAPPPGGVPAERVHRRGEEARSLLPAPGASPRQPRPPPPGRPRRASRPAHPRAVPRRSATDLKCHFEDVRKDLLTTSLFS